MEKFLSISSEEKEWVTFRCRMNLSIGEESTLIIEVVKASS
jgi:hypothetical protein